MAVEEGSNMKEKDQDDNFRPRAKTEPVIDFRASVLSPARSDDTILRR